MIVLNFSDNTEFNIHLQQHTDTEIGDMNHSGLYFLESICMTNLILNDHYLLIDKYINGLLDF